MPLNVLMPRLTSPRTLPAAVSTVTVSSAAEATPSHGAACAAASRQEAFRTNVLRLVTRAMGYPPFVDWRSQSVSHPRAGRLKTPTGRSEALPSARLLCNRHLREGTLLPRQA